METSVIEAEVNKNLEFTNRILQSQCGSYSKKKAHEEVALYIYQYPIRYLGFSEDENSEFFSTIYESIPKIIKEFIYKGIPFEHFIAKVVHIRANSFRKNRKRQEVRKAAVRASLEYEESTIEAVFDQAIEYKPLPAYVKGLHIKHGMCQTILARRQILCLTLIAADEIPEAQLDKLLAMCGCEKATFTKWTTEILRLKRRKREQLNLHIQRRNKIYILLMETKSFLHCCIKPEQKAILEKKIIRYEDRLQKLQKTIGQFSIAPSHKDLSEVTGIPRGTISTTLARSKQLLRKIEGTMLEE